MAEQSVSVPINGNSGEMSGWIENVSQYIDATKDVVFVDRDDSTRKVEVSRIQLDTAGYVAVWGREYTKPQRKRVYLEAGGWHVFPGIYGIACDDTGTGLGIHVKI